MENPIYILYMQSVYTDILQFLFFSFLLHMGKKNVSKKFMLEKKKICCSNESSFTHEEETRQMRALFNLRTCESFKHARMTSQHWKPTQTVTSTHYLDSFTPFSCCFYISPFHFAPFILGSEMTQ